MAVLYRVEFKPCAFPHVARVSEYVFAVVSVAARPVPERQWDDTTTVTAVLPGVTSSRRQGNVLGTATCAATEPVISEHRAPLVAAAPQCSEGHWWQQPSPLHSAAKTAPCSCLRLTPHNTLCLCDLSDGCQGLTPWQRR